MLRIYDLLIILAVLAGMAFAGLRATRGRKGMSSGEYFLAGQDLGWVALSLSLFVTTVWGLWAMIMAKPSDPGLSRWFLPGGVFVAGLILLALLFARQYKASRAVSVPSFLAERFGSQVGVAFAVATIGLTLVGHIPLTILAGTRLVNALLGWDPMSTGLLMVVIPGLVVVAGGFPAMIAAQSTGAVAAAIGLSLLAVNGFSGNDPLVHRVAPEASGVGIPMVIGMAILGVWSVCSEQHVAQRVFAARSTTQARAGTLAGAGLVLAGILALAIGFEGPLSGDSPATVPGITGGIIGAAVLAFGMATLCGHFMSIATLVTMDVIRPYRRSAHDAALVLGGRLAGTATVILAILVASSLALIGPGLQDWVMPAVAVVAPPMFAVLLVGMFWRRVHGRGAGWALVAGWTTGVVQVVAASGPGGWYFYGALLTFAVAAAVCIAVSFAVAPLGALRKVPGTVLQMRKP